jgi:predicted phage tail component-like protein
MKGLTFNGVHSNSLGLIMSSKNRPMLPEPKTVYEDLPGIDGEYDFSAANPDGRVKYKPVVHEIEFAFAEKNMSSVRAKARQVAAWLAVGEKQLAFDDEPGVYWLATVINKLDIEGQFTAVRRVTIHFRCRPMAISNTVTTVTQVVTSGTNVSVSNPGQHVRPVVRITGSCTSFSLSTGGKTLSCSQSMIGAEIVLDCEKMQAIKDGGININTKCSGSFLELAPGMNTITIAGVNLNFTVSIEFRARYL